MSRRKRTSCGPPSRITVHLKVRLVRTGGSPWRSSRRASSASRRDVLPELDPVAVRVADIEQAHLTVQLEDAAAPDATAAQPVGLGLDFVHLDVCNGPVLDGLTDGKADRGPVALEP